MADKVCFKAMKSVSAQRFNPPTTKYFLTAPSLSHDVKILESLHLHHTYTQVKRSAVPPAPDCRGRLACAWPLWPLPHSVPEPEPWPCRSLRHKTCINKDLLQSGAATVTHTHTHIPHVLGSATLHEQSFFLFWSSNSTKIIAHLYSMLFYSAKRLVIMHQCFPHID